MIKKPLLAMALLAAFAMSLPAAPVYFRAFLDGPSEEPPNASPGVGYTIVGIDPVAHTLSVNVEFSGLIGNVTVSHIHVINGPGDANTSDTNGPVATTTPTFPGFPAGVTSGNYANVFDTLLASTYRPGFLTDAGGTPQDAENALFAGIMEGRAYLNIHSNFAPGGEIRGFLAPVPEPATVGLTAAAFAGLLLLRRRAS
jgi:hypothetical protein